MPSFPPRSFHRLVVACLLFPLLITAAESLTPAKPEAVNGLTYDLAIFGGTPGGIACAVRAAREGLHVLLVNRHAHIGGMMTSGLGVWDTQFEGKRSPIYDEVRAALMDHYRVTYGADSPQYLDARPGPSGYTNGRYEPHIAEQVLNRLIAAESGITVLLDHVPTAVQREGAMLQGFTLQSIQNGSSLQVKARMFADASYEGDLLALAKVPYAVGRESRDEYDEPHAGVLFMRPSSTAPNAEAARLAELHDQLNLRKFPGFQEIMTDVSTGLADEAVQACNYRTILTTDPNNRVAITKPANYDAYFLKSLEIFSGVSSVPNGKFSWNRPQLIGQQTAYIEADWKTRQRIEDEHWEATLGLLYFLQNDLTVPEIVRKAWLEYGLSKDEFADNDHRAYEMYVRETRRLLGRAIFTEHTASLTPGGTRTPIQADSIAMTEWYMDCHSCTQARVPGGLEEGKMMLHHETFPAQLPYRCLLPQGVDNLLVPVCVSASHVAWGTVRLEPAWMQIGESAGLAAALAQQTKTTPAALDPTLLVRRLSQLRSMISFFNDVDVSAKDPVIPAVLYFGTLGFFHNYNAELEAPLKAATAQVWATALTSLLTKKPSPESWVKQVAAGELSTATISRSSFLALLPKSPQADLSTGDQPITRREALTLLFSLLP